MGRILKIVQSMYRQIKNRVCGLTGELSEPFTGTIGLRQGESLFPLLFSFLVNDVEEELHRKQGNQAMRWGHVVLSLLMYADDLCIIADSPDNLQQTLNILSDFCEQWNLKVNPAKSQVIIFSKTDSPDGLTFKYCETELVIIDRFKYLGITFTTNGSWEINTETLCGQARKAVMSLRLRFHQYEFSPHEKYCLFNQLVGSILSYGAEVWGHIKANDMELLHRKFLKEILCVRSST